MSARPKRPIRETVALVVFAAMALVACDAKERVEIRADGSATVELSVELSRDDPLFAQFPEIDEEALTPTDPSDVRALLTDLLALSEDDPLLDDLDVESSPDVITIAHSIDAADLAELGAVLSGDTWVLALTALRGATIVETDTEVTLIADAETNLNASWLDLLARQEADLYRADPLLEDVEDGLRGTTTTVELVLPGRIIDHDAHEARGNTLRWSWTVGEPAGPGISATWDPSGEPDTGSNWWGWPRLGLYGVAMVAAAVAVAAVRRRA